MFCTPASVLSLWQTKSEAQKLPEKLAVFKEMFNWGFQSSCYTSRKGRKNKMKMIHAVPNPLVVKPVSAPQERVTLAGPS